MRRLLAAAALVGVALAPAVAQDVAQDSDGDPARGAVLAAACAACHGRDGVSVEPAIPNLAAQKQTYVVDQLEAFRAGERSNALMNAIAAALSDADIAHLAAHFASLPGAAPGATGEGIAGLDGSRMALPTDYESRLVRYHRIEFPDRKQVRDYWAQPEAAAAAAAGAALPPGTVILTEVFRARLDADGAPVIDAEGRLETGERAFFTAMEKIAGAGAEVPEIYRNGDWRYAVFAVDGSDRAINEARCLACHAPERDKDYVFTHEALAGAAP